MHWYINDLSLEGQFATPQDFCAALTELLRLRARQPLLKKHLFCSRLLSEQQVTNRHTLQQAVNQHPDRLFKRQVLDWIANRGPFWSDTRTRNDNDYFTFEGEEVTEQGLGEAARRCVIKQPACVFSFCLGRFEITPLAVQHGWREPELDFGRVEVLNIWTLIELKRAIGEAQINAIPTASWQDFMVYVREQFNYLKFDEDIEDKLCKYPADKALRERIFTLLSVLDRMVKETDNDGERSAEGQKLYQDYFVGENACFSDSSDTEKRTKADKLTFKGKMYPWHGKTPMQHFRIHFEWPIPVGQRYITVVYIGPKLTK